MGVDDCRYNGPERSSPSFSTPYNQHDKADKGNVRVLNERGITINSLEGCNN